MKTDYKIWFTGSQGTGKTTILNQFKEKGYNIITEVVRNLAKEGVNINTLGDADGQNKIFSKYLRLFSENNNYISDRGLTDVISYTCYLSESEPELADISLSQINTLKQFLEDNPDLIIFYFPIEFPVVADGVRSTDEEYRNRIDEIIRCILAQYCKNFYMVKGTVEERIKYIENIIQPNNIIVPE